MINGNGGQNPQDDLEKSEWPKQYDVCPNCGSKNRLAQSIADAQIRKGSARKDLKAWIVAHQSMIADMGRPQLSVPVLTTHYDVCADCGTFFCVGASIAYGVPQMGKSPGFGG